MTYTEAKADFAKHLVARMTLAGICTAKELADPLPGEQPCITPQDAANYMRGRSIPLRPKLTWLATKLQCQPADLVPEKFISDTKRNAAQSAGKAKPHEPKIEAERFSGGGLNYLRLHVNVVLPNTVALQMATFLRKHLAPYLKGESNHG